MDIQVNKVQLERVVVKWLNKHFGNLTPKKHRDHPNYYKDYKKLGDSLPNLVLYVNSDNEVMMEYNQENEYVFIHYNNIWSKIKSLFHLNYGDIKSIMKVWLEETYKLEGVTPIKYNLLY